MIIGTGLSNKEKAEKVKNLPNVSKGETNALTALSKGFGLISTTQGKEAKTRTTPMSRIQETYETKTEVTANFTRLFKYINQ